MRGSVLMEVDTLELEDGKEKMNIRSRVHLEEASRGDLFKLVDALGEGLEFTDGDWMMFLLWRKTKPEVKEENLVTVDMSQLRKEGEE